MKTNTSKKKNFYTQGKRCAARVLLIAGLLVSYSPRNVLAAPDTDPQHAMAPGASNSALSLPPGGILQVTPGFLDSLLGDSAGSSPSINAAPQECMSQEVVSGQGDELLRTSLQAREGEDVRFHYQNGQWRAEVSSRIGDFSRRAMLPVVCSSGEDVASSLAVLSKYPSWQRQRQIHVLDRNVCPTLGEVVYVGELGLKGGGNTDSSMGGGGSYGGGPYDGDRNAPWAGSGPGIHPMPTARPGSSGLGANPVAAPMPSPNPLISSLPSHDSTPAFARGSSSTVDNLATMLAVESAMESIRSGSSGLRGNTPPAAASSLSSGGARSSGLETPPVAAPMPSPNPLISSLPSHDSTPAFARGSSSTVDNLATMLAVESAMESIRSGSSGLRGNTPPAAASSRLAGGATRSSLEATLAAIKEASSIGGATSLDRVTRDLAATKDLSSRAGGRSPGHVAREFADLEASALAATKGASSIGGATSSGQGASSQPQAAPRQAKNSSVAADLSPGASIPNLRATSSSGGSASGMSAPKPSTTEQPQGVPPIQVPAGSPGIIHMMPEMPEVDGLQHLRELDLHSMRSTGTRTFNPFFPEPDMGLMRRQYGPPSPRTQPQGAPSDAPDGDGSGPSEQPQEAEQSQGASSDAPGGDGSGPSEHLQKESLGPADDDDSQDDDGSQDDDDDDDSQDDDTTTSTSSLCSSLESVTTSQVDNQEVVDKLEKVKEKTAELIKKCEEDSGFNALKKALADAATQLKEDPNNAELQSRYQDLKNLLESHPFSQKIHRLGRAAMALREKLEKKAKYCTFLARCNKVEGGLNGPEHQKSAEQYQAKANAIDNDMIQPLREILNLPSSPGAWKRFVAAGQGFGESLYNTAESIVHLPGNVLSLVGKGVESLVKWEDKLGIKEGYLNVKQFLKGLSDQAQQPWETTEEHQARLKAVKKAERRAYLDRCFSDAENLQLSQDHSAGYMAAELLYWLYGIKLAKGGQWLRLGAKGEQFGAVKGGQVAAKLRKAAALQRGGTVAKEGSVGSEVIAGTKLLPQFNSVESLIQNAGKLRRLKKGVREGWITGNADDIFIQLANQYGVQVQTGAKGRFFISGNIRVDLGRSSTSNTLTLYIDNNRQLFKIRIK